MDSNAPMIAIALTFVILLRVVADRWDRSRITTYVQERGGEVQDIAWQPFGRGWFGERGDRIYEVTYRSRDGATHEASCKTSLFSGVYFSEEQLIAPRVPDAAPPALRSALTSLQTENEQLKREVDRLKRLAGE